MRATPGRRLTTARPDELRLCDDPTVTTPSALAEALDALPKVELHCHIEGTLRPGTLIELARRNGVALPTTNLDELYRYDSLDGFLRVFWLGQSTLAARDDWARLGLRKHRRWGRSRRRSP